jgi:hypothetical protein
VLALAEPGLDIREQILIKHEILTHAPTSRENRAAC